VSEEQQKRSILSVAEHNSSMINGLYAELMDRNTTLLTAYRLTRAKLLAVYVGQT